MKCGKCGQNVNTCMVMIDYRFLCLSCTRQTIAALRAQRDELLSACKLAKEQISALDDVLNEPNHYVTGWHLNGDSEPVSSFFEDYDLGAIKALDSAIANAEKPQ